MISSLDLPTILAFVVAFSIFVYVVMDGFDLGVALLFPFFPERHDRDVMMNSVAPVWDGNETWLVLGGGALFCRFPTRLCDPNARALHADHRHAARSRLSWRRLRVPLAD